MLAKFSRKMKTSRHDETPTTPTGDFTKISSGSIKASSIVVAGVDLTQWELVQVDVLAGPLGILLDGSCAEAAILDDFAPVTPDGTPGTVEASGQVPHGSFLVGMNGTDFLQPPRKKLAEIGKLLQESAHQRRRLVFRVPPQDDKPQKTKDNDKSKLLSGPTSSSTSLMDDNQSPAAAIPPPVKMTNRPASFVRVTGMEDEAPESESVRPYVPKPTEKIVKVDVPAGSLGLNLDGTIATRAVVLGFIPLADGSRGAIEQNGSIKPGSDLVEINGQDVSQLPLAGIREKLSLTSNAPQQLGFRLPAPPKLEAKSASTPKMPQMSRQISALCVKRMSLIPQSASSEDLKLRRGLELKLIMSHDRNELKFKECWFAVSAEWMNSWVLFVAKDGPKPGAISNHLLLAPGWETRPTSDPVNIRPGLEISKDFRFVTPMVWSLLAALHGSGGTLPIARYVLDINSEAVEKDEINDILRDAKPQAGGLATNLREKCHVKEEV